MNRDEMLSALRDERGPWDVIVIGGGATGLGAAIEAAARGWRVALLEQNDFAKATSSRSTKLAHGGVRYLRQGDLRLVHEALVERGRLRHNAPHLVHALPFIVPLYNWREGPYYRLGLKAYDLLAGRLGFGPSRPLSREETLRALPTLEPHYLRGGICYFDGQFDDARLAVTLARTLADLGGVAVNYLKVIALLKNNGHVCGMAARDEETGETLELRARAVINATGIFADAVRQLDDPAAPGLLLPSQGVHLVLDGSFLANRPGAPCALMVPRTEDGRVLFAIPWHGRTLLGTTDTPVAEVSLEPRALAEEVEFLLRHAGHYLTRAPGPGDVRSVFAGLRPLVRPKETTRGHAGTAAVSRDHLVIVATSGLVTVTGGKWTTYRLMGEDAVNAAERTAGLTPRPSPTRELRLHGWTGDNANEYSMADGLNSARNVTHDDINNQIYDYILAGSHFPAHFSVYGSDAPAVWGLCAERPEWRVPLHPRLPYLAGETVWAARHELARTVEDVLARRTRALLLDAQASLEAAPEAARWLAQELHRDETWARDQVSAFQSLARGYLI